MARHPLPRGGARAPDALEHCAERLGLVAEDLRQPAERERGAGLLETTPAMQRLRDEIALVGPSDLTVLITGETGRPLRGEELAGSSVVDRWLKGTVDSRGSEWQSQAMDDRRSDRRRARRGWAQVLLAFAGAGALAACSPKRAEVTPQPAPTDRILTGADALGDWSTDAPGVKRKITVADLPPPNEDESVVNRPSKADRPAGAFPKVPSGFAVTELATGLDEPRVLQVAPNGDVFVAESGADRVTVLRDADGDGKAEARSAFAEDLNRPFGIAFYPSGTDAPTHVYVANTDSVVRFPYKTGDTKASGPAEPLVTNIPSGKEMVGGGGHWTRDIAFSKDNQRMFVSVGSRSNVDDDEDEHRRACILAFTPDGKDETLYASGIRNPVGLAIEPSTGALWTSVNERDELGDNLVPDYVTRVQEGGFYGWPWYYLGPNQDPRHQGKRPELRDKVLVPDVLIQSHSASLDLCFYTGQQFPADYQGHIFAAEHGSWNRSRRTGYKVIRIPVKDGKAEGYYEDFMTGFVTRTGDVWGRPVGVAVAKDGALLVSDDQSNTVWRVAYGGSRAPAD